MGPRENLVEKFSRSLGKLMTRIRATIVESVSNDEAFEMAKAIEILQKSGCCINRIGELSNRELDCATEKSTIQTPKEKPDVIICILGKDGTFSDLLTGIEYLKKKYNLVMDSSCFRFCIHKELVTDEVIEEVLTNMVKRMHCYDYSNNSPTLYERLYQILNDEAVHLYCPPDSAIETKISFTDC